MAERELAPADAAALLALGALWGGSFLFLRVAAPQFGPVPLIALRVAIGAVVLLPALGAAEWRELRENAGPLFALGVMNCAVPFSLFAFAALSLTAGFTAILNSTAPIFTALAAWAWLGSKLTPARLAGLAVGFAGVVMLAWERAAFKAGGGGAGVAACLLATLLYGISQSYIKKRLARVSPLACTAGSLAGAASALALPALWARPAAMPAPGAWLSLALLGALSTGAAFLIYYRLMARVGPTRAMTCTFLVPPFGMLWGRLFLAERVTPAMAASTLVILAGTALSAGLLAPARRACAPAEAA